MPNELYTIIGVKEHEIFKLQQENYRLKKMLEEKENELKKTQDELKSENEIPNE